MEAPEDETRVTKQSNKSKTHMDSQFVCISLTFLTTCRSVFAVTFDDVSFRALMLQSDREMNCSPNTHP